MKKVVLLLLVATLSLGFVPKSSAASKSDQALALASSACLMGWLDLPTVLSKDIKTLVVGSTIASQWNDLTNNKFNQIHHIQFSEGWNSASLLDRRWKKLSDTYEKLYDFVGNQIQSGRIYGEVLYAAERKYGGVFNSNCKIAVSSARSKAKSKSMSLPAWIISNAGDLLPELDPRSARS
jgi:hypothetical protein